MCRKARNCRHALACQHAAYADAMVWLASLLMLLLAGQIYLLLDREVSWRQRLHELGEGGDSWLVLLILCLIGAALGAPVGSLVADAYTGAALGSTATLCLWLFMVVRSSSQRRPKPEGKHREDDPGAR